MGIHLQQPNSVLDILVPLIGLGLTIIGYRVARTNSRTNRFNSYRALLKDHNSEDVRRTRAKILNFVKVENPTREGAKQHLIDWFTHEAQTVFNYYEQLGVLYEKRLVDRKFLLEMCHHSACNVFARIYIPYIDKIRPSNVRQLDYGESYQSLVRACIRFRREKGLNTAVDIAIKKYLKMNYV